MSKFKVGQKVRFKGEVDEHVISWVDEGNGNLVSIDKLSTAFPPSCFVRVAKRRVEHRGVMTAVYLHPHTLEWLRVQSAERGIAVGKVIDGMVVEKAGVK